MIDFLMLLAFLLRPDPAHVDRLVAFAPAYLDTVRAREHIEAACLAAAAYRVDCSVLLAIAFNESRFNPRADGAEANGMRACGLMGRNRLSCDPRQLTLVDGYFAGAEVLRGWINEAEKPGESRSIECRKRFSIWQCAMMGYAGGWNALNICNTRGHANCGYPDVVLRRARKIRGYDAEPF